MEWQQGFLSRCGKALRAKKLALVVAAVPVIVPLLAPLAGAETMFTFAAAGGSWGKVMDTGLKQTFEKEYGVSVRHDVKGNVQRLLAMIANPGKSGIDAVEVSGSRIGLAIGNNVLEKLDASKMPNYQFIPAAFKNEYWAGGLVCPLSVVYNPAHVTAEEAASWDVLANPKFKGHVGIPEYTWQGENWLHAVNRHYGGTYDNLTPGIEFAAKVMRNGGTVIQSPDHGLKLFAAGDLWVAAFLTGRAMSPAGQAIPLRFTLVKYWWPLAVGFAVVKGTPNLDLAYKFVNASLSPSLEIAICRVAGCAPTNVEAALPD
ncbi:MAG: PotD/PotF family extracellular solute-binding protein, partial [Pseudorhodoplanes sp.]